HAEHDEVIDAGIDLVGRARRKRPRQGLRRDLEQRFATADREAHPGPFTPEQLCRAPGAHQRDPVPVHQQLGAEQGAVMGPENENVVCHLHHPSSVPTCTSAFMPGMIGAETGKFDSRNFTLLISPAPCPSTPARATSSAPSCAPCASASA